MKLKKLLFVIFVIAFTCIGENAQQIFIPTPPAIYIPQH